MSPSSSGSWSGGRGADIIDLDRYMRGNVRPSRPLTDDKLYERLGLVVDGGGVSRKPCSSASGDARLKRYSHDSGVSDGSYRRPRRAHRPHRRGSGQDGPNVRTPRELASARTLNGRANSSSSLRAFRMICEQALLDQQRQIARVAELCERLTERAEKTERSEKSVQNKLSEQTEQLEQSGLLERSERNECNVKNLRAPSVETSEISSSSRSTKDLRRKDKHRTQECKTYKIIMNKLDELNRMFATRPPHSAARNNRAPHISSSTSVSVCDKLIATDPQRTVNRVLMPTTKVARAPIPKKSPPSVESRARSSRMASVREVTHAYAVDIAPCNAHSPRANIITESIVCDSSSNGIRRSVGDPRFGFDLEDPVRLYTQAKRLQGVTATRESARRARSVGPALVASRSSLGAQARSDARSPSLCAVCRAYWRYLRQCVAGPVVGRTFNTCKSS